MVKHIFDCFFSFSEPPEIRTVKGLSAVGTDKRQKCRLCSQSRRATTCATPRYFYINFFLISLFSSLLCPPSCGSRNLFGSIMSLDIPTAAPKNVRFFCHRQRSRFFPKAGGYHLRYTSIFLYQLLILYLCFLPCFVRPLAVPVISSAQ